MKGFKPLTSKTFEKILQSIKFLLDMHQNAHSIHPKDNESKPMIGKEVRLRNLEQGKIDIFSARCWFRPRNFREIHGMKELSKVAFQYPNASNDEGRVSEVDLYNLYKGGIIRHQHQEPKPRLNKGIYRYMWVKPDLTEKTGTEFLNRIDKLINEEKNKGLISNAS